MKRPMWTISRAKANRWLAKQRVLESRDTGKYGRLWLEAWKRSQQEKDRESRRKFQEDLPFLPNFPPMTFERGEIMCAESWFRRIFTIDGGGL